MTEPESTPLLFEAFLAGAQLGAPLGDDLEPHFQRWLAQRPPPDPEHVRNAEALKQRVIEATQPILDGDWSQWDRTVALLLNFNGYMIAEMVRERRPVRMLGHRVERVLRMIEEKVKQDDLLIRSLRALAEADTPSSETERQLYDFKQAYAAAMRDPVMVERIDKAIAEVDAQIRGVDGG